MLQYLGFPLLAALGLELPPNVRTLEKRSSAWKPVKHGALQNVDVKQCNRNVMNISGNLNVKPQAIQVCFEYVHAYKVL